jgi:hypothetical protein
MIKLKDLLLENDDIFIPRRIEDRQTKYNNITQKEVNTIIDDFIDKRYNMSLNLIPKEMDDNGYEYGTMQHDGEFVIPDKLKSTPSNLVLDNSRVTKLPDNLTIGVDDVFSTLSFTGCLKLHQLPKGLKVTVIDGASSGIRVIPNDIKCDRINLDSAAYITELPLFKNYIETINLTSAVKFKTLPAKFTCGTLNIIDTIVERIPDNVKIKYLKASNCKHLKSIGNNCEIDNLILINSMIESIPTDIKCSNYMNIRNTPFVNQLLKKQGTSEKVMEELKRSYPYVNDFGI